MSALKASPRSPLPHHSPYTRYRAAWLASSRRGAPAVTTSAPIRAPRRCRWRPYSATAFKNPWASSALAAPIPRSAVSARTPCRTAGLARRLYPPGTVAGQIVRCRGPRSRGKTPAKPTPSGNRAVRAGRSARIELKADHPAQQARRDIRAAARAALHRPVQAHQDTERGGSLPRSAKADQAPAQAVSAAALDPRPSLDSAREQLTGIEHAGPGAGGRQAAHHRVHNGEAAVCAGLETDHPLFAGPGGEVAARIGTRTEGGATVPVHRQDHGRCAVQHGVLPQHHQLARRPAGHPRCVQATSPPRRDPACSQAYPGHREAP